MRNHSRFILKTFSLFIKTNCRFSILFVFIGILILIVLCLIVDSILVQSALKVSSLFAGLCPSHDGSVLRWTRGSCLPCSLLLHHCSDVQLNSLQCTSYLAGQEVKPLLRPSAPKHRLMLLKFSLVELCIYGDR